MRSTPVRDVSQMLANMAAGQAGKAAAGAGNFQKIWSSQMNMGNSGNTAAETGKQGQTAGKPQKGSSLQEKDRLTADRTTAEKEAASVEKTGQETAAGAESGTGEVKDISGETGKAEGESQEGLQAAEEENAAALSRLLAGKNPGELAPGELERAMEILGGISAQLMQQIADAFGVSLEELQAVMEGLNMESMDLLDAGTLGELLLTLGGAQDSYALITDGELYEKYRMLMAQLESALQEGAEALDMEPGQLQELLKEGLVQRPAEEVPLQNSPKDMEALQQEEYGEDGIVMNAKAAEASVEKTAEAENREPGQESPSQEKTDRNSQEGLYMQEIRTDPFQSQLQQTQQLTQSGPWSENTRDIMNQILDYMKVHLNADSTNLEMQLHPASLGTVQVQLASRGGVVTAHFIAQNEGVKNALETQMIQLREQFEEQGIKVEAIEVTVQSHEFERNLEQGRGRNQQTPDKKGRARRVQLSGAAAVEETGEEVSRPSRTVDGGSTVEYSA